MMVFLNRAYYMCIIFHIKILHIKYFFLLNLFFFIPATQMFGQKFLGNGIKLKSIFWLCKTVAFVWK